jgi:hypothetical protein
MKMLAITVALFAIGLLYTVSALAVARPNPHVGGYSFLSSPHVGGYSFLPTPHVGGYRLVRNPHVGGY